MQGVAESQVGVPATDEELDDLVVEQESTRRRTVVIVLVQLVAVAAFAVIWSIMRSRRSSY